MAIVPFLTYKILPSQTIVRENIRLGHVRNTFPFWESSATISTGTFVDQGRYRSIDPCTQPYSVYYENRWTETSIARSRRYPTSGRQSSRFRHLTLVVSSISSSMAHWIFCVSSVGFPIIETIMRLSMPIHRRSSLNVKQWLTNFGNSSMNWRKWRITRSMP